MSSTTDINDAVAAVSRADLAMAALIKRAGPYEPRPGAGDYFAALARSIMFQQLAGRAAAAIHGRFVQALGGEVTPAAVLSVTPEALRAAGLSGNKTAAIVDLATKALDGTVPLDSLGGLDDEDIIARLSTVRGIGRWTAEMFLMFELSRPDVWPVDDFGVRNGWTSIHSLPATIKPRELLAEGEKFRPYRSIAAWYCWRAVSLLRGEMVLPDLPRGQLP
jgi:DNA-3-methyladenine glycosylase II